MASLHMRINAHPWLQLSAHFSNVIFELIAATRGICYAPLRLKPTLNGIKLGQADPPRQPLRRGRQNRTDKQHLPTLVLILPSPNSYYVNIHP